MNIVVMGAGAIGSLFGGLLSNNNRVILVGRKNHVAAIQKKGLRLTDKTSLLTNVEAVESVEKIDQEHIDLILLTVKAYDTEEATMAVKSLMNDDMLLLSLQNGLDNIEKITRQVNKERVAAGVTTHGALLDKPGVVHHTGLGELILGELDGRMSDRIREIASMFEQAGITTKVSSNILMEIWKKAIVNSSINPLTTLAGCTNGVLLSNSYLHEMVIKTCAESAAVARTEGMQISDDDAVEKTRQVIENTAENVSSMLQSMQQEKPTEIDSINGHIVACGQRHNVPTPYNETLHALVKARSKNRSKKNNI